MRAWPGTANRWVGGGGGVGGGRPWGQQGGEGVRAQHQHAVGGLGEVEGGRGARA
jgi:hypothetical protein